MDKLNSLWCYFTILLILCGKTLSQEQTWCIASQAATVDQLQAFIDSACRKTEACRHIQPGEICYEPNNVRVHGSYILNSYYAVFGVCHPIGIIIKSDPSYDQCYFPRKDDAKDVKDVPCCF